PLLPEPRARLCAGDREAARPRGPREGDLDADVPRRAESDAVAPRLARDGGAGAGLDLDVLVLLPRARLDPRPLRDGLRDAHAYALFPGRRARRGHPARLLPGSAPVRRLGAEGRRRLRGARPPDR